MKIRDDIFKAAKVKGINPYKTPFKASELGLKATDYGSFSDYCEDTESSKYNPNVILKPVEFRTDGKPLRYVLIK